MRVKNCSSQRLELLAFTRMFQDVAPLNLVGEKRNNAILESETPLASPEMSVASHHWFQQGPMTMV